jgi:hypothetical protein
MPQTLPLPMLPADGRGPPGAPVYRTGQCRLSPRPSHRDAPVPGGPASSGDLPCRGAGRRPHGLGRPVVGGAQLPQLPALRHPRPRIPGGCTDCEDDRLLAFSCKGMRGVSLLQRTAYGGGGGPPDRRGDPPPPRPSVGAIRSQAASALAAPDERGSECRAWRGLRGGAGEGAEVETRQGPSGSILSRQTWIETSCVGIDSGA